MVQINYLRRVVVRDGQHSRSISGNGHAKRRTWSRPVLRVRGLEVTGALELEGVVGHGRGLCASSLSMLFARCIGTAFILGQMGCIKKHTTLWWLWNEHFIHSNYYSGDKSDHYSIEMLSHKHHAYHSMSRR